MCPAMSLAMDDACISHFRGHFVTRGIRGEMFDRSCVSDSEPADYSQQKCTCRLLLVFCLVSASHGSLAQAAMGGGSRLKSYPETKRPVIAIQVPNDTLVLVTWDALVILKPLSYPFIIIH